MSRDQWLVDAQVDVNRAVWAMNREWEDPDYRTEDGLTLAEYREKCIQSAIVYLRKAARQKDLTL